MMILGIDPGEEWRPVNEWYAVSNIGRVYSWPRRGGGGYLKARKHNAGYLDVSICINGRSRGTLVHRLVAEAFIGPCPDGHEVDHVNSDRRDNRVENLRYLTHAENARHPGEENGQAILSEADVLLLREMHASGLSQSELARAFCVHISTIHLIVHRKKWRHLL